MESLRKNKLFELLLIVLMAILAGMCILYYWSIDSFESLKFVPMKIMIFAFCYILLQIFKRFIFQKQNWWDWLYYIGLLGIVIPSYFASIDNFNTMLLFAQIGTWFLIIPLLLDVKQWFRRIK